MIDSLDDGGGGSNPIVWEVSMICQSIETRARTAFVTGSKIGSFPGVFAGGGDPLGDGIEANLSLGVLGSIAVGEGTTFGL